MVGVVLITQGDVAAALLRAAEVALGRQEGIVALALDPALDDEGALNAVKGAVDQADQGEGVLVLVDVFGGTPSNLAMSMLAERKIEVLTGVNVPMVVRAAGRRGELPFDELARDVLAYGRRNVTAASDWLRSREQ